MKIESTAVFFFAPVFLLSGCMFFSAEQKIERLKKADSEHRQMLTQELDTNFGAPQNTPETKPQSSLTLEEGDVQPAWVTKLPAECELDLYCGLAFVDFCENANSCREEAETKARDDLRKRIAVKIQSQTSSRIFSQRGSGEEESGQKTFQSEIREQAVFVELKNVRFTHFYLRPQKQLQTLARMKRPEEIKTAEKTTTPTQSVSGTLPPLLPAFTNNEKTPNLNRPQTVALFQQRFAEALRRENAILLNDGAFQDWKSLRGIALRERAAEALGEHPQSVAAVLSLSGRLDAHKGRMFKGLATVFLNIAAYGKEGAPLFRKSFTVRRFMSNAPDKLTVEQKQEVFLRTVKKGVNEFEDKLVTELKLGLSR